MERTGLPWLAPFVACWIVVLAAPPADASVTKVVLAEDFGATW